MLREQEINRAPFTETNSGPPLVKGSRISYYGASRYVVGFDAHCNFNTEKLRDTSLTTAVEKLRFIFARYEIPVEVFTENGPQLSLRDIATFVTCTISDSSLPVPSFPVARFSRRRGCKL